VGDEVQVRVGGTFGLSAAGPTGSWHAPSASSLSSSLPAPASSPSPSEAEITTTTTTSTTAARTVAFAASSSTEAANSPAATAAAAPVAPAIAQKRTAKRTVFAAHEQCKRLVLVAGGIGITPLYSIFTHLGRLVGNGDGCEDGAETLPWRPEEVIYSRPLLILGFYFRLLLCSGSLDSSVEMDRKLSWLRLSTPVCLTSRAFGCINFGLLLAFSAQVHLLYGARSCSELAFGPELTALAQRYAPRLRITFVVPDADLKHDSGASTAIESGPVGSKEEMGSRGDPHSWLSSSFISGVSWTRGDKLSAEIVAKVVNEHHSSSGNERKFDSLVDEKAPLLPPPVCLLCGPPGMVDAVEAACWKAGVPPENVIYERWW